MSWREFKIGGLGTFRPILQSKSTERLELPQERQTERYNEMTKALIMKFYKLFFLLFSEIDWGHVPECSKDFILKFY